MFILYSSFTHGNEVQIPSTTTPSRISWVVICQGKNRCVDELHLRDPENNPTSSELLLERSVAKESELWLSRDGAIPHRGYSRDAVRISDGCSVLFRRSYSCWRKEVESQFCLQVFERRLSSSRSLKIGQEVGTSLRSQRKRNGRCCSLEIDGSKTATSVPEVGGHEFSDPGWLQHIYEHLVARTFFSVLSVFRTG